MTLYASESGLDYSAASAASVVDFEAAIASYLGARPDTMALLDALLAADPAMCMAVCFRGYLLKLAAHPQFAGAIRATIEQGQALAEHATARESAHLQALRHWCDDRADKALAVLESVLDEHPRDMLALRIAHYLHFYNGRAELMRDSIVRVLPAWREDDAHYGYLLGMHAFGLEEAGDYADALAQGRAAVQRNSADIWATHAVAHVHQMQGQYEDGIDWLQGLRNKQQQTNNFRYHVIWHEALYWLGLGEPAKALAIYDDELADSVQDDFYLDLCNNASLLMRLEFMGVDVGDRWQVLAGAAAGHVGDKELVFASLHYLMPLARIGSADAKALLTTLQEWAQSGTEQGSVCAQVGVALGNAIVQSPGAPADAAELLVQNEPSTYLIGGSHAQRDLFRLFAAHDARRADRADLLATMT